MRNKLILYFATFVMLTLVAFGLSAYHILQEKSADYDMLLLEDLARIQSEDIAGQFRNVESLQQIAAKLKNQSSADHLMLLLDSGYNIIRPAASDDRALPSFVNQALREMAVNDKASGKFDLVDNTYTWLQSKPAKTNLTIAHIYTSVNNAKLYQSKLIKRLVVMAIIIFWIGVWGALIIATVITRRIAEQQEKIEYQASHDMMTGLHNRNYLASKINQIIASKKIPSLSVIIIGINRFKEINNTLGHDFGDILLKEFSMRLKSELWSHDTVARLGSDQYALVLPLSDHAHWEVVIGKIEKILQEPFTIQDIRIVTDVSIGISIFPSHGKTASELLRYAEVAMYSAKKSGMLFACYETSKDPYSIERLQLIGELNNALDNNELELHFQPKIAIDSLKLVGCEALLRWNNPSRGRIPPDVFIPLAEQGSLIKSLTEWVLDHSIKQCADWHKTGNRISISVNLSARLLIDDNIIEMVDLYLAKYALSPQYLILEITESAMMVDPGRARSIMEKLANRGVQLSIDDFGTGYTSISQIQHMPVKEIKIDKSFVLNMLEHSGDAMLVKLIIDMAHGMGHQVTAEGIEEQLILDKLKSMGCDIAQGYFLGRPMPLAEFNQYCLRS